MHPTHSAITDALAAPYDRNRGIKKEFKVTFTTVLDNTAAE